MVHYSATKSKICEIKLLCQTTLKNMFTEVNSQIWMARALGIIIYCYNVSAACNIFLHNLYRFWCSTKINQDLEHIGGQGNWGYCGINCGLPIPTLPAPATTVISTTTTASTSTTISTTTTLGKNTSSGTLKTLL